MAGRKWPMTNYQSEQRRNEDLEELFVFGYQCKLFRDDEKALYIDQGRHLIPWMGDSSVMIDRYDGRGHLFDLTPYEGGTAEPQLTEEERQIEALCDEERYLELHTDLNERAMYEEEELKRLNEALQENSYGAVEFNYNESYDPAEPTEEEKAAAKAEQAEDVDEPFVAPEGLQLRPSMPVPATMKQNTIIEKTAWFVCQHGGQMEIVVKTKQKNNPQFSFLEFGDDLNSYYKHILSLMKKGRYRPMYQEKQKKETVTEGNYLHPSLAVSTASSVAPAPEPLSPTGFLQSVQAKLPSGQLQNSVYASLVSKMSKHTALHRESTTPVRAPAQKPLSTTTSTQSKLPATPLPTSSGQTTAYMGMEGVPPPPGLEPVTLPPSSHSNQPPPPGTVPARLPRPPPGPPPPPIIEYGHRPPGPPEQDVPRFHGPAVLPPPPDLEPIIDKMASYVARNGPEFEMTVRNKGDPRFAFLHSTHIHFGYYDYKKQHYLELLEKEKEKEAELASQGKAGLSFSIKMKNQKDSNVLDKKRSALPQEDSDDENSQGGNSLLQLSKAESSNTSTDAEDSKEPEKPSMSTEQLEKRLAQEKLKDKLAVAARDKLAQASKEKQLQAERKRKAAMFINMLKTTLQEPASAAANSSSATSTGSPRAEVQTPGASPLRSVSGSPVTIQPVKASSPTRRFSPSRVLQVGKAAIEKRRSRSRSPRRRHSKSPKHRKAKTPPSGYDKFRSRSRSPLRQKKRRSRSRSPKRSSKSKSSRSHTKRRSRSRSKSKSHKRKRSRSRSRSPKSKKSKSRDKERHRRKGHESRHGSKSKSSSSKDSPVKLVPSSIIDQENEGSSENTHLSGNDQWEKNAEESQAELPSVETNGSADEMKNGEEHLMSTLKEDEPVETGEESGAPSPTGSSHGTVTPERSVTASPDHEEASKSEVKPSEELRAKIRAMLKTVKEEEPT